MDDSSILDNEPSSSFTQRAEINIHDGNNNDDNTGTTSSMNHKKTSSSSIILILENLVNEASNLFSEGETYFTNEHYEAAEIANARGLKVIESISMYLRKNHSNDDECQTNTHENVELEEEEGKKGVVPISIMSTLFEYISSCNNNSNNREYYQYKTLITKIIHLQFSLWTNQVFVLNEIDKFEESNDLCTVALDAIERERKTCLQIVESSSSSSNEAMTIESLSSTISSSSTPLSSMPGKSSSETILEFLSMCQIRIKHSRARANKSLKNYSKANQDLQENLIHLKQRIKDKKGNCEFTNTLMNDTIHNLDVIRETLDESKVQQVQEQDKDKGSSNDDDDMKECYDDDSNSMMNTSQNKSSSSQEKINDSSLQSKEQPMEEMNHDHDMDMNNDISNNTPQLVSPFVNGNITKTQISLPKKKGDSQNNTKLDKAPATHTATTTTTPKSTNADKHYPSPDKQKQIIMKLLNQSPRQGEAFFIIHYDWWKLWTRHVNFFNDYEYSKLLSAFYTHSQQHRRHDNDDHQNEEKRILKKLEKEMIVLEKERNSILSLLPMGAIIPEIIIEREKKNKRKRTVSDDSSSLSSSSEEENSDDENEGVIRNLYGSEPTAINNSNLLYQCPRNGSKRDLSQYDGSSLFYYEWNHLVKQEGVCLENKYVLRPRLVRGHHFEVLPREVYAALRSWYGESTPSICRRVIMNNTGSANIILYPELQWNESLSTMHVGSNGDSNGNRSINFCGACRAKNARSRCSNCSSIFYCDSNCQASHWPYHKSQCKVIARQKMQPNYNPSRPSKVLALDPRIDLKWGRVGLSNLGNTCFMNSALQCLSHSAPLTRHFLTNRFKNDLNFSNPLGAGGKLANAYDVMIKEIWMSEKASIAPTALKRAIAMFAPRFSGMNQHDSQEFLAFLLDGLHEDLNRVKNPPYIEKADVTHEHNLSIAGEESWDAHCLRNRSIVMDTFYGAFKSTCICPMCKRVSVSFDAFNHISLEIPQRKRDTTRIIPIVLFKSSSSSEPVRYAISVPFNAHMVDVKMQLSQLSNVPVNRLFLCDVYESKIYEIIPDEKELVKIDKNDVVVAYEIDPYSMSIIHMISYHRLVKNSPQSEGYGHSQASCFGYPLFSSFGTNLTCKQVWQHFMKRFAYLLPNSEEDCFQIRLVDCDGNPRPIFGNNASIEQKSDESLSILPQSNDKFSNYVGGECAESFLFVAIEWNPYRKTSVVFDDRIFNNFSNDVSVIEAIKKQRSSNSTISLENCLEQFTQPERLDEDNKWYCSSCKTHVRAEKTMEVWRLPNVLIVHLKRFEFKHSLRREKLETIVDFPIEGLDMSKYCAQSSNDGPYDKEKQFVINGVPAYYDLFGVVNHYGRMGFGHYTSFARRWTMDNIDDDWVLFDDSAVRGISKDQVISSAAYVLFYRRRVFV